MLEIIFSSTVVFSRISDLSQVDPDLLDMDPPENASKFQMSKLEIYHSASNNRIALLQREFYQNWVIDKKNLII